MSDTKHDSNPSPSDKPAKAAARLGDEVVGVDSHIVMLPSPAGPVPTPMPMVFRGKLIDGLSSSVYVDDKPAAVEGSAALANPPHMPQGGPFQRPPTNRGVVERGSVSVFIDEQGAARATDPAKTCGDPLDVAAGVVQAASSVEIGD